jgi:hypothetical protein
MIPGAGTTVEVGIDRVLAAYADLAEVGEDVEDEWSYIQDLTAAWRARLAGVTASRGKELLQPATEVALEAAIDEIASIDDAHRAIDWLSTFPQVTLVALGETP